jgi:hypothetical protein
MRDKEEQDREAEVSLTEEELRKSIEAQKEIVLSDPDHRWFTGERFGHDPKPGELWIHWADSGAAERFRKTYSNRAR